MTLINCKVELKLKWSKYCALSGAGADYANNIDSNNITFTIKDTKLCVPVVFFSARDNQKLQKLLSKGFKRSVFGMNIKQKVRTNIRQINLDIFSNQILLESIGYLL